MKIKKVPLRTCVVTKEKLEKKDLFRIVKNNEGKVFIDDSLKANGRGCYLKKDASVIDRAKNSKVLNHHLGINVEENIFEELKKRL